VAGVSNRMAHAAAESVIRHPGELSPLLIHGPTAVGKTHLLEGIWTAVRKRHPGQVAVYLSAEQFTTVFLQALRGSGLPSFRRKYRGVDLLLLDDLQFFSGKRCTQIELLYTVDTLLRDGRQLVLAADRPPEELSDLGPELMTRLASGLVCRIESPDYDTRLGIVTQMARRLGMKLPDDVRSFIASRLTNHARELSGALCRLHAAGRAWGRPITLPMAEEALAELIRSCTRIVRLPDIEKAVCDAFGLEPKTLQAGGKAKCSTHPRMLAMWLARKYTRSALSEISRYFGRRSHSTVISAQKSIDRWLASGKPLHLADHTWKVDDAIHLVERRLAAG
jgi:chromosomal replication initiator protein